MNSAVRKAAQQKHENATKWIDAWARVLPALQHACQWLPAESLLFDVQ